MIKYLALLTLAIFIGCKSSSKPKETFFGGKIINPKCDYVILSDNYNFNDTIYLKKDNTFLGTYKTLKKGLYSFEHGAEHQYVYLEPNDSLLFRLNTWDFDESLVFSGKNAARNNMLIESFLQYEEDSRTISKYYNLPKNEFLNKIDSLKNIKQNILENYKKSTSDDEISESYIELLNIALLYPIYTSLEKYATKNLIEEGKLNDFYFNFRENTNFKKDSLMFYGPYYRYVIEKIYTDTHLKNIDKKSENFTNDLLNSIDKEISSEEIKNRLLYNTIVRHFFKEPSDKNRAASFFTFFKLNTNIKHKKNIQRLVNDLKILNKGEKLSSFKLVDPTGKTKEVHDIIKNKNAVILFKNYRYATDDWVSSRINYLIKNNPKVEFIVINLCSSATRYTKNIAIKYQYKLPKNSNVCDFSSSKFPRMVLVNKKGIVTNGYTSLSAKDINLQINNLQNNK